VHGDKRLFPSAKRDAPPRWDDSSSKCKTAKRQGVLKSASWYQRAASSISAAPRQAATKTPNNLSPHWEALHYAAEVERKLYCD